MNMNTSMAAPMVQIHPRHRASVARLSIDEVLENERGTDWFTLYDEFSLLHVPGAAHLPTVHELLETSPNERLRGFIEGLYLNS